MVAPPSPPPLDLGPIIATLRGGKATDAWVRSWLPETHAAPARFVEALYFYAISKRKGLKSRPGLAFNFYQDLVVANLENRTPALFVKEGGSYVPISYGTLHDRCTMLSAAWKRLGCERGESICVLLPVGLDYVVAVLTGLRMGLVVSTLEPCGPAYVRSRLQALAPSFTVTSEAVASAMRLPLAHQTDDKAKCPVCGSACKALARALPLAPEAREAGPPPVATYAPDAPVFTLLSPFAKLDAKPVTLMAADVHAALLRDGLVALGLEPSDVVAAPGFDPMLTMPHLLLATFAAGAGYALVTGADLEGDPKLAENARISILGVSNELRDRILARGADWLAATGHAWFKELSGVTDVNRWDDLARALDKKKMAGFNVFLNAATGGIELFSPRAAMPSCLRVWPVPGRSYLLSEVAAGDVPKLNNAGVYTVTKDGQPAELPLPQVMVTAHDDGYLFLGSIDLAPAAQVYPSAEVSRAVAQLAAVRYACVILAPGRLMNDARTVLLVFTDDARGADNQISLPVTIPQIKARVAAEMGERYVPERIAIYPLRPRLVEGVLDEDWCRSQFLSGSLDAMARSEMFVLLSRIGYIVAGGKPGE